MSDFQAATRIIFMWRHGRTANSILMQLVSEGGWYLRRSDVMYVIRSWIDAQTENRDYGKKEAQP